MAGMMTLVTLAVITNQEFKDVNWFYIINYENKDINISRSMQKMDWLYDLPEVEKCEVKYIKVKTSVLLFKKGEYYDCIFKIGDERMKVHTVILAYSSPVFQAMFYGPMASNEVEITDISGEDFKQMLKFVYWDVINFTSVLNAWTFVYISKKYLITDLLEKCVVYIQQNLGIDNMLLSFEYAEWYDTEEIATKCWEDILVYVKGILLSDYHMKSTTFCSILNEEFINASEEDLLIGAVKWANDECMLKCIEPSVDNKRLILIDNGIFALLRFLNIASFSDCLLDFFSAEDVTSLSYQLKLASRERGMVHKFILNQLCKELNINISTKKRERKGSYFSGFKIRKLFKIANKYILKDSSQIINVIYVNKKIILYGVAINTRHRDKNAVDDCYAGTVGIQIHTEDSKEVLNITECSSSLKYDAEQYIEFDKPMVLEPEVKYKLMVKYFYDVDKIYTNEILTFYMNNCIVKNNIRISFYDEFNGSVVRGLLFYPF